MKLRTDGIFGVLAVLAGIVCLGCGVYASVLFARMFPGKETLVFVVSVGEITPLVGMLCGAVFVLAGYAVAGLATGVGWLVSKAGNGAS